MELVYLKPLEEESVSYVVGNSWSPQPKDGHTGGSVPSYREHWFWIQILLPPSQGLRDLGGSLNLPKLCSPQLCNGSPHVFPTAWA